jgi:hypothetical protein
LFTKNHANFNAILTQLLSQKSSNSAAQLSKYTIFKKKHETFYLHKGKRGKKRTWKQNTEGWRLPALTVIPEAVYLGRLRPLSSHFR